MSPVPPTGADKITGTVFTIEALIHDKVSQQKLVSPVRVNW